MGIVHMFVSPRQNQHDETAECMEKLMSTGEEKKAGVT